MPEFRFSLSNWRAGKLAANSKQMFVLKRRVLGPEVTGGDSAGGLTEYTTTTHNGFV